MELYKSRAAGARDGRRDDGRIDGVRQFCAGYQAAVHDKQYRALQMLNTETVALYWAIGREIYRQQREKGWGKSVVEMLCTGLAAGVSGGEGIFGGESLAHAQFLPHLS